MPNLSFAFEDVEAPRFAVAPLLLFKLRVSNADANEPIHTVLLRCQIQIEVQRRRYAPEEQERLLDLFGDPERWSRTLRTMLWTHVNLSIPGFSGSTVIDLPVPCSADFDVAAAKYFYGVEDGEVPLAFLFSGSVFYTNDEGALQVVQIPWEKEASFRLPVRVWKQMMDAYYPNSAWLHLRRDVFDQLYHFKMRRGLPTWEQAIESLLPAPEGVAEP
jgi:hypothetical protein